MILIAMIFYPNIPNFSVSLFKGKARSILNLLLLAFYKAVDRYKKAFGFTNYLLFGKVTLKSVYLHLFGGCCSILIVAAIFT